MPKEFPVAPYETVHDLIATKRASHPLYEQYGAAWNAIAYRYRGAIDSGEAFVALLAARGPTPPPEDRYLQEKTLFEFFSAGFAVFEAAFYGMYAIGGMLDPSVFILANPADQQRVTPGRTGDAYKSAFPNDSINVAFATLFADAEYRKLRETRNVLTHRASPGRRIFVSIGADDAPPVEWKLNNLPLGPSLVADGRRELVRLLGVLLDAGSTFARAKIS